MRDDVAAGGGRCIAFGAANSEAADSVMRRECRSFTAASVDAQTSAVTASTVASRHILRSFLRSFGENIDRRPIEQGARQVSCAAPPAKRAGDAVTCGTGRRAADKSLLFSYQLSAISYQLLPRDCRVVPRKLRKARKHIQHFRVFRDFVFFVVNSSRY
ncbi:MAG: hypothetical protein AUI11_01230 [Acidobacteria bacterium 13_2_20CM_2_66_4]|nr:MAG: hypothetical protein AUI11_01230 [Acidobacteria bacterium 13_2_20CM_2_66_4]